MTPVFSAQATFLQNVNFAKKKETFFGRLQITDCKNSLPIFCLLFLYFGKEIKQFGNEELKLSWRTVWRKYQFKWSECYVKISQVCEGNSFHCVSLRWSLFIPFRYILNWGTFTHQPLSICIHRTALRFLSTNNRAFQKIPLQKGLCKGDVETRF